MKKAGILLAVLAAAILLKTQVWDRLTRPSAAENNLDRAYSITEIRSAADDLYSGFGLLPEDFDWEAACRESYYQAAEAGSEYDYYLEPVSYTQLDVYKRQMLRPSSSPQRRTIST